MSERLRNTTLALALVFAPSAAGEAPATEERCATVYDQTQTNPNTIDPLLADSLTLFGDKGVTTHIQILDGAAANNITDNDSLAEHVDDIVYKCEWQDGNSVVLSLVRFTREESKANNGSVAKFDVRETGPIDGKISNSAIDDANIQLGQDLRNPADSYQEDLAKFLKAINPPITNSSPNDTTPQPETNQETHEATDWANVFKNGSLGLLAIGGLVGLGFVGYRGKEAYEANVFRRNVEADITKVISGILTLSDTEAGNIYATGNQLDIPKPNTTANEDPGLEGLRSERADLDGLVEQLRAIRDQIKQEGSAWRTSTLQNLAALQASYEQLVNESLPKEQSEYLAARNAAVRAIETVGDRATQVNTLLEQLRADIDTLEKSGWDVSTLNKERGRFSEADGAADSAIGREHLLDASNKIDGFLPQLIDLSAQVQTAETTLAANQVRHLKRDETLDKYTKTATQETALLEDLSLRFHSSCIDKVEPIKDAVAGLSDQLHRKQAELSLHVEAKSFDGLRRTATLTNEYSSIEISLAAKRKELNDIVTKLEGLVELLPETLANTRQSYLASRGEVQEWGTDIDEDLVDSIVDADRAFANIEAGLDETRPAYFAIEENLSETTARVEAMMQQANVQRQQANELRSIITNGNDSVKSELSRLRSYISGHPDARGVSANIEARSFSTDGTRATLRQTLDMQDKLRKEIDDKLDDAKAAVAAAEAERRRKAEAERARQQRARDEAEAAERRAAASRNTGDVGRGPSHRTGNL